MPDTDTESRRSISRRKFVKAAGASGVTAGIAGCTGNGGGDGGGGTTEPGDGGDGGDGGGQITIQFASDDNFKSQQETINEVLHNNGVSDNVKLEILGGSFVSSGRQNKYKNILNAGQKKPTLFMMDNGWTIPFIVRDQIANLSDVLSSSTISTVKNDYLNTMVATAMQDGDLYGVPLFADFGTIQYRKDLVKKAGYSESDFKKWATESMTWKEFSQVVKKSMEANPKKQGFNFQAASYIGLSCCDFVEFMSSWGGSYFGKFDNLFGPVGDRPITVDEKPVKQSINMIRHFIYGDNPNGNFGDYAGQISPKAVVQYKEESSRKPFTNGNVLFHRNWPYSIDINADDPNKKADEPWREKDETAGLGQENLGVMPIPYAVTAEESNYGPEIGGIPSALGGWHVTLNPNAPQEKKDAAKQIFRAMTKTEVQLGLLEAGGWLPPVADTVRSDAAKEKTNLISPYLDTLAVAGENAVPRPVTRVWPQEADQVESEVNAAIKREKSASKAMSSLKSSLEELEQL
ncbi:MAG: extracellular solute-binding protein [Haloarculaceae archaeon]